MNKDELRKIREDAHFKEAEGWGVTTDADYVKRRRTFEHGFDAGYEAGKPKWTPVSERLPRVRESVLVTWYRGDEGFAEEALLTEDDNWEAVRTDGYNEPIYLNQEGNVIAWRPLPEPYTEGE